MGGTEQDNHDKRGSGRYRGKGIFFKKVIAKKKYWHGREKVNKKQKNGKLDINGLFLCFPHLFSLLIILGERVGSGRVREMEMLKHGNMSAVERTLLLT